MRGIKKSITKYKMELAIGLVLAIIFSKIITSYFFYVAIVPSESMKNTLMIGDRVLVSKKLDDMKIGEIYTFYHENKLLIKRLIAKGGDHIKIINNDVFVNGEKLYESYVSSQMSKTINVDVVIPEGKFYFLGDNRNNSNDARFWSDPFIDKNNVDGRAVKLLSFGDRKPLH